MHQGHSARRVLVAEGFGEHLHDVVYQPLLHLQAGGAVVHCACYLRESENAALRIGQVGEPVFAEEGAAVVLADRVEGAGVHDHVVVDDSVLPVGEGGYLRLLCGVVAAEYLPEHPEHTVGGVPESGPVGVFADVFEQFPYVLPCLFFRYHLV